MIRQALADPSAWLSICDRGRLHCTMILDALIRLARSDEEPVSRNLGILASSYLGVVINKDDPYRLRFGEIIGKPWGEVEAGFFSYAIADAIVTHKLWLTLSAIAAKLGETIRRRDRRRLSQGLGTAIPRSSFGHSLRYVCADTDRASWRKPSARG